MNANGLAGVLQSSQSRLEVIRELLKYSQPGPIVGDHVVQDQIRCVRRLVEVPGEEASRRHLFPSPPQVSDNKRNVRHKYLCNNTASVLFVGASIE